MPQKLNTVRLWALVGAALLIASAVGFTNAQTPDPAPLIVVNSGTAY